MAERDECIPEPDPNHPLTPAGWEESAGFRETFLYHYDKLEDSLALRHLARMLHEQGLEMARYAPLGGESATRAELRAVAADLRHAQGFLAAVARSRQESELAPVDAELAALAAGHAQAVASLAAALEQALA
ncbi:MAG TPA: hypothetical protein VEG34_04740 [Thermoanaerobaculia bacterium]|nr:hypothetical protein [Thermoanaerobaculia bacterium]